MNYTSIEQSKRLLELGLSPESADMFYLIENFVSQPIIKVGVGYNKEEEDECNNDDFTPEYIPCWSLGALLAIMPESIPHKDSLKIPERKYWCYGWKLTPNTLLYECYIAADRVLTETFISFHYEKSPIEAAYNMVVWLLENNYIKH